jgi:hypothetical protein
MSNGNLSKQELMEETSAVREISERKSPAEISKEEVRYYKQPQWRKRAEQTVFKYEPRVKSTAKRTGAVAYRALLIAGTKAAQEFAKFMAAQPKARASTTATGRVSRHAANSGFADASGNFVPRTSGAKRARYAPRRVRRSRFITFPDGTKLRDTKRNRAWAAEEGYRLPHNGRHANYE